jgi:hypothetical protein
MICCWYTKPKWVTYCDFSIEVFAQPQTNLLKTLLLVNRIQGLELCLDGGFRFLYTASWIMMLIYVITRSAWPCCSLFWMYSFPSYGHIEPRHKGHKSINLQNEQKWNVSSFSPLQKNALNRERETLWNYL